jgi:anti-anti-sigma factor
VIVSGDLDLTNIASFQSTVEKAFGILDGKKLIIDLRETDYIDSAGLEQLLAANRKLSSGDDRLLVRVREGKQPQTVLAITGFNAVMDVESS